MTVVRARSIPRFVPLLCLAALLVAPRGAGAQARLLDRTEAYFGLNVLLGGGVALAQALLSPGDVPPGEAFLKGALGGAVMYGGQRMVGSGRSELRLAGVQTVALGASLARNAGAGTPLLSELTFPLFPLYVHVRPGADSPVSVRLSAAGAASLVWALTVERESFGVSPDRVLKHDVAFDWRETLLSGAPVFRSEGTVIYTNRGERAGSHLLGTTWFTTGSRQSDQVRSILTHEAIHLTQFVRDALLFGVPAGDAVLGAMGGSFAGLRRYLALDVFLPMAVLNEGLSMALPENPDEGRWRLYEREAKTLSGTP